MLVTAIIYSGIAIGLAIAWYTGRASYNRRRSRRVLQWIESALAGRGRVLAIQWTTPGTFRAHLQLAPNACFHDAAIEVRFRALSWLLARWRKEPDLLTFEADLDPMPTRSLELHRHRWYGRTRRKLTDNASSWPGQHYPTLVITTEDAWDAQAAAALASFPSKGEYQVLSVVFQRSSPQFSVTVPLANLAHASRGQLLPAFEELASGASAWSA